MIKETRNKVSLLSERGCRLLWRRNMGGAQLDGIKWNWEAGETQAVKVFKNKFQRRQSHSERKFWKSSRGPSQVFSRGPISTYMWGDYSGLGIGPMVKACLEHLRYRKKPNGCGDPEENNQRRNQRGGRGQRTSQVGTCKPVKGLVFAPSEMGCGRVVSREVAWSALFSFKRISLELSGE